METVYSYYTRSIIINVYVTFQNKRIELQLYVQFTEEKYTL